MFRNYFKTAWRNITKNPVSSFINISGLALGMSVAILIGLWIYDEVSFNNTFQNHDRIAQLNTNANYDGQLYTVNSQPLPLANALRQEYGDDFKKVGMSTATQLHVLSLNDKKFNQKGNFMQPDLADMLSLKMLKGSGAGLQEPNSILLSESVAAKIFPDSDPLNQVIQIDAKSLVKVTGIYEDFADNTDFKEVSFIAPFELYVSSGEGTIKKYSDWNSLAVNTYVQLQDTADFATASARIKNLLKSNATGNHARRKPELFLHPMNKWHLYSKFENGVNVTSDLLRYVWYYGIIGGFVLLLACINFMNLSTARSEKRAKEVGIRKSVGSLRIQLIKQFYVESILVAAFAFLLSILIVEMSLPWFNNLSGKNIHLPSLPLFWSAGLLVTVLTGLIAGSYPALYLSSFNPIKTLKGSFRVGRLAAVPRQFLVVLQFVISTILIISTTVVYRQIVFAKDRPLGYSQESLVQVDISSPAYQGKYDVLRNELKSTGVVSEVAESASPVTSIWSTGKGFNWDGKANETETEFATLAVTHEYGKTVGWQFIEGRDFAREQATDSGSFVINESAVRVMGLQQAVGKTITWNGNSFRIIGVVKDMVMESPYVSASPSFFFVFNQDPMNFMLIKPIANTSSGDALGKIEKIFRKINPATQFNYSFVSAEFNKRFAAEERIFNLAFVFAGLAIIISCLGLFGLASFIASQRTKEIGLRKVLGASIGNVWSLLIRDFVRLVIIAFIISAPIAYFLMYNWLQNYSYRTALSWWIFAGAGLGTLLITLLTVSFQSIKSAIADPVDSLRME